MGALTITNVYNDYAYSGGDNVRPGSIKRKVCTATPSASYSTGGETFDAAALTALGLQKITGVTINGVAVKTWIPYVISGATWSICLAILGSGVELAAAQNCSTAVFTLTVEGY